ncbi:hypothetical protein BCV70DRAFT_197371 [Testicularia cyperi]|uniref:Citrate transporter-like domain-containing protein n=1 Tax=Testicularia cyperi TaxID=1882483 RepID=A0A317XXV6_9BASI|nr:hypothetical protein BCV70DRAFT_197371 [Testicularia cyperi]
MLKLNPLAISALHHARDTLQASIDKRAEEGSVTLDTTRTSLNGFGVFAIIVFACVSLIVIRPLRIPLPQPIANVVRKTAGKVWLALAGPATVDQEEEAQVEHQLDPAPRSMHLVIDHVSAPVIGVLILLATTTIGGEQVRQGIVGEDGIEPYDVLALFISLAYIAISLDATGLIRYLAFLICLKAGRQGREAKGKTLFLLLYFFFWTAGVLVGNDPVILSGTAFLVYFTRVAGISPPDAWIWAEFVAANISSAVLVSSNPTNLVIASGFNVNFITYTAYMVLPAFGSAVGGLVAIMLYFRNRDGGNSSSSSSDKDAGHSGKVSSFRKMVESVPVIGSRLRSDPPNASANGQVRHRGAAAAAATPIDVAAESTAAADTPAEGTRSPELGKKTKNRRKTPIIYIPETIIRPDVDPRAALVDKTGAIFGSIVMAATLATLVGTSVVGGVKVFEIAVPGAVLCLTRDAVSDYLKYRSLKLDHSKPKDEFEATQSPNGTPASNTDVTNTAATANASFERSRAAASVVEEIEMNTLAAPRGDLPTRIDSVNSLDKVVGDGSSSVARADHGVTERDASSSAASRPEHHPSHRRPRASLLRRVMATHSRLCEMFPTVSIVLSRLPFPLLPFAFSMFILVQALAHVGFINIMAAGLGRVCSGGYVATAFFISFLGVVLCNIGGTNIGATILLTKSVRSPFFTSAIQHLSSRDQALITKVAQYSIAFGSNVGALGGTFAASLAGLLWLSGLRQGGISVKARNFLLWCLVVVFPSTVIGIAIIIAEVRYFHVDS